MRLSPDYVTAINTAAHDAFGPDAVVRLFGSRIDDTLKGGDIDLHIEVEAIESEWAQRGAFEDRLFAIIDPKKVDVLPSVGGNTTRGFERIAYRDGIVL